VTSDGAGLALGVARAPAASVPAAGYRASSPAATPAFDPMDLHGTMSMLDPTLRAQVMASVQRSAGNQSVQQVFSWPQVQRCTQHAICPECAARGETAEGKPLPFGVPVQGDFLDDAKALGASGLTKLSAAGREALHVLSCIPLLRAVAIIESAGEAAIGLLVAHAKAGTMPTAAEAQILLPVVEKALITTVCNCLPDSIVTAIALHVYLAGQPLAQKHLQHYLTGGGADFTEDIPDLFARNPTIRNNVASQVGEQSSGGSIKKGVLEGGADLPGGGNLPGFPPITQDDYDDQDWRNSIGNVDKLEWSIISGPDAAGNATVRITLSDPYAWHPKEARLTQCVHQAIENMKAKGAAEFMARGTGDVVLNLGSGFKPGPNAGPR
jgi:hypothetical protein